MEQEEEFRDGRSRPIQACKSQKRNYLDCKSATLLSLLKSGYCDTVLRLR
jgi:hypothetical protein